MSGSTLKVMTVTLAKTVAEEFEARIKDINLRRDSYLADQLKEEVERLAEIPAPTDLAISYVRLSEQYSKVEKLKIGLKLPEELIARINEVCQEKRVPRDIFVEIFLDFLANGYIFNDIPSPLAMASAYLSDPFRNWDDSVNIYSKRFNVPEVFADLLIESFEDQKKTTSRKGRENE